MKKYIFSENNSGGHWWLDRAKYDALLGAGWQVPEAPAEPSKLAGLSQGLSGPEVPYEWRHGIHGSFESIRAAVESFEAATGENFFAEGCNCCGAPFSIYADGAQEWESLSGDSVERHAVRPW